MYYSQYRHRTYICCSRDSPLRCSRQIRDIYICPASHRERFTSIKWTSRSLTLFSVSDIFIELSDEVRGSADEEHLEAYRRHYWSIPPRVLLSICIALKRLIRDERHDNQMIYHGWGSGYSLDYEPSTVIASGITNQEKGDHSPLPCFSRVAHTYTQYSSERVVFRLFWVSAKRTKGTLLKVVY
jgi:hypothetical protein